MVRCSNWRKGYKQENRRDQNTVKSERFDAGYINQRNLPPGPVPSALLTQFAIELPMIDAHSGEYSAVAVASPQTVIERLLLESTENRQTVYQAQSNIILITQMPQPVSATCRAWAVCVN